MQLIAGVPIGLVLGHAIAHPTKYVMGTLPISSTSFNDSHSVCLNSKRISDFGLLMMLMVHLVPYKLHK